MATVLSNRQVLDEIEIKLTNPTLPRPELWKITRQLQSAEQQLDGAVQDHVLRHGMEGAQRALEALRLMEQTLRWVEQHRWGMLRLETRRYLLLAHDHAHTVLAMVEGTWDARERLLG